MFDFTMMDLPLLVEHARQNSDAFGELYRRYLPPVFRYLYRSVGDSHDAEDLTTQVFIEALEGLATNRYCEDGRFVSWLFTIARRRRADFYRQHSEETLADLPSPEPGLVAASEKSEDLNRLASLITQLDEQHQELLRMRYSAGLSFAEIGQIEGRSEAAVKMTIYRMLEHLRARWEVENG